MRQGQNSKRSRGRGVGGGSGGGGRRNVSPRHQTFDSNGPSVRIRGSAHQVHEKYLTLARDATSAGDRIAAENYYQHAEHYFRIINVDNEGDGRGRSQQNGADDRGGNARNDQGNRDTAPEMDGVQMDGEPAAPAVEVIQANGSGDQPDVAAEEPEAGSEAVPEAETEAEQPVQKRTRAGRGNGRGRTPRASSRKADDAGDPPAGSNGPDKGNEDTPQADE